MQWTDHHGEGELDFARRVRTDEHRLVFSTGIFFIKNLASSIVQRGSPFRLFLLSYGVLGVTSISSILSGACSIMKGANVRTVASIHGNERPSRSKALSFFFLMSGQRGLFILSLIAP